MMKNILSPASVCQGLYLVGFLVRLKVKECSNDNPIAQERRVS